MKANSYSVEHLVLQSEQAEIQHRTFVAWINHFLKERQMSVSNLRSDFSDGIKLINLVEV